MRNEQGTIIGQEMRVRGSIQGDEDITVYGRIEGNVRIGKTLVVEESGIIKAEQIDVANIVINGALAGNIEASESILINAGGRVIGDLKAPRIVLSEGALFRGMVDMGPVPAIEASAKDEIPMTTRASSAARSQATKAATKTRPAPRPAAPPKRVSGSLGARASAAAKAAKAVARKVKQEAPVKKKPVLKKVKSKKKAAKAPKPPTTAGRKTKAKRK